VAERQVARSAGDPSHDLLAECELVRGGLALELQHAETPVHLASVVESRDRLLARIAALREAHVRLGQAGLGRKNRVVDLPAPAGNRGFDAPALELLLVDLLALGPLV